MSPPRSAFTAARALHPHIDIGGGAGYISNMLMQSRSRWSARSRFCHRVSCAAFGLSVITFSHHVSRSFADEAIKVDTALLLAVDVSQSVDESRYRLQMEGIARSLEDKAVIDAITSGQYRSVAIALDAWADHSELAVPWQIVRSAEDGRRAADMIRNLPLKSGEYTCMARMMRVANETVLDDLPFAAARLVIDVSGDGIDNCAEADEDDTARNALIARGVTINGLPIIVPGENDIVGAGSYREPGFGLRPLKRGPDTATTTLDAWYGAHVIGGTGAFQLAAHGYDDFERAFRRKFVTEISWNAGSLPHPNASCCRFRSAASAK